MKQNDFPDQNLIGKLLGAFYDPKVKPLYVRIDYFNNEIHIRYKHNDFIDVFGDNINGDEIKQSPGEMTYEKSFKNGFLTVYISTYIILAEVIAKKLSKMWGGSSKYANI